MFIIAYFLMRIADVNGIDIPSIVTKVSGIAAIIEASVYAIVIFFQILVIILAFRNN